MSQHRTLVVSYKLLFLLTGMIVLLGMGAPTTAWSQQMVESTAAPNPVGTAFIYQGRLSTGNGPATGTYDFQFTLYDAETGGTVIGATLSPTNVSVNEGIFLVSLDFGPGAFSGASRWLAIEVRPAGGGSFEALTPRQPLTPVPYAIYADNVNLNTAQARVAGTCADGSSIRVINGDGTVTCEPDDAGGNNHDHLGQTWGVNGNSLTLEGAVDGLYNAPLILNNTGNGSGLVITSQGSNTANGLNVESHSGYPTIFAINQGTGNGVVAVVQNANAINVRSTTSTYATVYAENLGAGPSVVGVSQSGAGGDFETLNGSNIIEGYEIISTNPYNANLRFKVTRGGNVNADGTFSSPASDFAEMLPAVTGLAPGDVLVIGPQGTLIRSSSPNAANVAGVYSTKPGFVGGLNVEDTETTATDSQDGTSSTMMANSIEKGSVADAPTSQITDQANVDSQSSTVVTAAKTTLPDPFAAIYAQQGKVPLAVIGIVPVKVTAENGPIQPGDLLTTSSTPGRAMKASPVNLSGIELYRPGTILGKALEPWAEGAGVIQVLIVLQ